MFNRKRINRKSKRGFTLLEIMAVVVIIGLLAGAVTVAVRGNINFARKTMVKTDLIEIDKALKSFEFKHKRYPTEEEGLELLKNGDKKNEIDVELEGKTMDPWDNPYEYRLTPDGDEPYMVTCYGADGIAGGTGLNADVTHIDAR